MSAFADDFAPEPSPPRQKRAKAAPGPKASERQVQMAILDRLRTLGVFCAHIPNGGKRGEIAGARLKQEGMRAGMPDVYCAAHGRHVWLEVKAADGRPSRNQIECHADLRRRGVSVVVVYSQDEAVEACREAGVVK